MPFAFTDGSFELGYDGTPWNLRSSTDERFYHLAKPVRRPLESFRKEAIRAATEIRESRSGTIYIPYSGGADSEGICTAFRLADIAFTPLIVVYANDMNKHDVDYAFDYCKRFELMPVVEHIDLADFYASGRALEIARMCQAWELAYMPVLSTTLKYRAKGFTIGPGEASISRVRRGEGDGDNAADVWMYTESERHYCYNKFMMAADMNGVPSFYQWSSELVHSYLRDPLIDSLANGLYADRIWGSSLLKHQIYQKHLRLEPRTKFTGFETFLGTLNEHNQKWRESEESRLCLNQPSEIPYWTQMINARETFDE